MLLTVIGSGDAFNSQGRGHSCYILEGDSFGPLMVDAGATALMGLYRYGRRSSEIRAVAVTHLHGDHIGGFPYLVLDRMFRNQGERRLEVLGPIGCSDALETLLELTYPDVDPRAHDFELSVREIVPDQTAQLAGVGIRAFSADHMDPPHQPLCLRITTPSGEVVAFSGDSGICDGLLAAANGADLLVAECSCLKQPCGRHTTWDQWLEVMPRLDVRRILFSHLGGCVRQRIDDLTKQLGPKTDVRFADDGMVWRV